MFGWLTGSDIVKQVEEVRDIGIQLGHVRAAKTVQVYRQEVDLERTYTGIEVSVMLSDIVTVLIQE